ncbi:hypothetical protein VC83_00454 [Pseudogymnoascus destructans]|uniref:Uncharacterized protein n=1 Tax=Pseudogymnoascus destructans TaxID=655981 RepID=A0A177AP47_9PEZI|nr:uncharacterized protein VC83_00454 [Pseudogymnoascus destructans]OAF63083.1 hypothetical protein VC83_00454 [Pseudogymnoascus destructans]
MRCNRVLAEIERVYNGDMGRNGGGTLSQRSRWIYTTRFELRWNSNSMGVLEFVERQHISAPGSIEHTFQCRKYWPGVFSSNVQENKYPPTGHIRKGNESLYMDIYYTSCYIL